MPAFTSIVFTVAKIGLAAAATGAAAFSFMFLRRKSNTLEARAEQAFRLQLLQSVADWSAPRLGRDPAALRAELDAAFAVDWQAQRSVPGLARIDLRLQRDGPSKVTRTVGVRLSQDSSHIGALSREYSWDQLPARFRSAFIRQGESTLCWSLYEVGPLAAVTPPTHAPDSSR